METKFICKHCGKEVFRPWDSDECNDTWRHVEGHTRECYEPAKAGKFAYPKDIRVIVERL